MLPFTEIPTTTKKSITLSIAKVSTTKTLGTTISFVEKETDLQEIHKKTGIHIN